MRSAAMIAVLMVASLFVPPYPVAAQETRAEAIRQEQAEKQKALAPPQPNAAERLIDRLEDWGLIAGGPRGVHPWFGSVYSGGGFAAGAGVRKPFGDDGAFNIFGGYSINSFARAQADLALPTFARMRLSLTGRYVDAPDVRFASRSCAPCRYAYVMKSMAWT
jgi:hypothetical protein